MPIRFRRTFTIFPGVKANVSKSGVSFTVGTRGYHLNFSKRGVKQTVGVPGSGISQSTYLVKNDPKDEASEKAKDKREKEKDESKTESQSEEASAQKHAHRRTPGWVLLLGLVIIYVGAVVLGLIPVNFLSQILGTLLEWTRSIGL
jgi:hypothetical protein